MYILRKSANNHTSCFGLIAKKQERCEPFQDDRELLWVDLPERGLTKGRVAQREGCPEGGLAWVNLRVDQREGLPEGGLNRGRVDQREG